MTHVPSAQKRRRRRRNELRDRMILMSFDNGRRYLLERKRELELHPTGYEHMTDQEIVDEVSRLVGELQASP